MKRTGLNSQRHKSYEVTFAKAERHLRFACSSVLGDVTIKQPEKFLIFL